MASVTLSLNYATDITGQAANVVAKVYVVDGTSALGTLKQTVTSGWFEGTDGTGAPSGSYNNSITYDTASWGTWAVRVIYSITGFAGSGEDLFLQDFAAFCAKLIPASLPFEVAAGSAPASTSITDNLTLEIDSYYAQTLPVFTISGLDSTGWSQFVLMFKANPATDADSAAILTVKVSNPTSGTDGLVTLNGAPPGGGTTSADASLSVIQTSPDTVVACTLSANAAQITPGTTGTWELGYFRGGATTKTPLLAGPSFFRARVFRSATSL